MDYQSRKWDRVRARILRRDKYICQVSKRYGKIVEANLVHHIFPVEDYPEYQWAEWNMISVSQAVHNRLHDRVTNKLTNEGIALLERTAKKMNLPPQKKY